MMKFSRTGMLPVLFFFAVVGATHVARPRAANAQAWITRSWLTWRTVETGRFVFHYPTDLEAWTLSLASRADAIDSAVKGVVGFAPSVKTHIVVDDPYETSNGSAWPFLNEPVINLWATPPSPRDEVGEFHDWGRTLLSHEFTHIAHLTRPSRNARVRALWRAAPVDLGPIPLTAPRWVFEGYATYAEGKVTGSGRPHGAWRPAVLRQWALEGQLPRYEQLDLLGGYQGGSFAYLAGSAFLEWLADRRGDSSLVAVWRRMTAREPRAFEEAFIGVYGESPRTLYGRFTVDLTGRALEVQRHLRATAERDTGEMVQHLAWDTGDPAVSRDGRRVAITLSSATLPARVVIWSYAADRDTLRRRRDSTLLARDPQDVPARSIFPPPKRVLATLRVSAGYPYESPRFLPDGRVLLSRRLRLTNGSIRSDLFIWNPQSGAVRRVTHRAALSTPDPSREGRFALATKCEHGWCSVARVDLATGRDSVLLAGSPQRSYFRPRYAPDGRRFIVSRNDGDSWRLVVASLADGTEREVPTPADSLGNLPNVYDASWLTDTVIVATSDVDGIPNLRSIDIESGISKPLTHVTGAAVGAEAVVRDSSIWFLSLHSRGYDVRRVRAPVSGDSTTVAREERLSPAAMLASQPPRDFPGNPVSRPRSYSLGDRLFRWAPLPQADADGYAGVLALASTDLVGKSEIIGRIAIGDRSAWHGGSVDFSWRGFGPLIRLEGFDAAQSLTRSRSRRADIDPLDTRLRGALLFVDHTRLHDSWSVRARLGASAGRLVGDSASNRVLGITQLALAAVQRSGIQGIAGSFVAEVARGRTAGTDFTRGVGTTSLTLIGMPLLPVTATAMVGSTTSDAPRFEQISLGGGPVTLMDRTVLGQRFAMPALPSGVATGTFAFAYRVAFNTQPFGLYFWHGSAAPPGEHLTRWNRVVGLEGNVPISAIPFAGVPAARIVYGVGESLDAPFRRQARGYLSVVVNP